MRNFHTEKTSSVAIVMWLTMIYVPASSMAHKGQHTKWDHFIPNR